MFDKYEAFIFDLDGTIYRGNNLIKHADTAVNKLIDSGKKIVFISNKTIGSVFDYYKFLNQHGIKILENQIITSTSIVKKYLLKYHAHSKFFAIGEETFIIELEKVGLKFFDNIRDIDIVIVTLDREFTYNKLEIAAKALENGAKFFAANIDNTCPIEEGEIWDAGSTISALEKRTHRKLETHFGKPSGHMMNEIAERTNVDFSKCLIIGDRLETDIALGNRFGIDTALVSTGVKNYLNNGNGFKPTYEIDSVYDLIKNGTLKK